MVHEVCYYQETQFSNVDTIQKSRNGSAMELHTFEFIQRSHFSYVPILIIDFANCQELNLSV